MQLSKTLAVTLLSSAQALTITEPKTDAVVQRAGTVTLSWTTVTTDPSEFKVSFRRVGDSSSNAVVSIPGTVSTKDKTVALDASLFPQEGKYTVYAVSTDNKAGILAESKQFEAKGPVSSKSSSSVSGTSHAGISDKSVSATSGTSDATAKKTTNNGTKSSGSSTVKLSFAALVGAASLVSYLL